MSASPLKIIDPHLHLFDLSLGDYAWLKTHNPPHWQDKHQIAKNYSEQDLTLSANMSLGGFVHIEAGFDNHQPWREIDWLESTCNLPFKSIACADLTSADFASKLTKLIQRPSVVGVRHILEDEALPLLTHASSTEHFALLNDLGLIFEAQLALSDTPAVDQLIRLAMRFKKLMIVLNHGGWPPGKNTKQYKIWHDNAGRLSACSNVVMKLSGWEMADRHYLFSTIQQVVTEVITCFGSTRVMLASNFPLCTFSCSYAALWQNYQQELQLASPVFKQLSFSNAHEWYKFG